MIVLNVGRDQKVATFKIFSFHSCNVSSSHVHVESTCDKIHMNVNEESTTPSLSSVRTQVHAHAHE